MMKKFQRIITTHKKRTDPSHKYIATAVEALIAAIYLDNKEDFNLVVEIANHWKMLIDQSEIQ